MTATPPTAASLLTVAAVAYTDAAAAPYYCACICAAFTAAFVPPLPPSFRTRGRVTASAPTMGGAGASSATSGAPAATVQSAGQAGVISMTLASLPTLFYIGTNFRNISQEQHLWSLTLLVCGAIMFFHLCPKALWWFPRQLHTPRMIAWGLSFLIGVAAIEIATDCIGRLARIIGVYAPSKRAAFFTIQTKSSGRFCDRIFEPLQCIRARAHRNNMADAGFIARALVLENSAPEGWRKARHSER